MTRIEMLVRAFLVAILVVSRPIAATFMHDEASNKNEPSRISGAIPLPNDVDDTTRGSSELLMGGELNEEGSGPSRAIPTREDSNEPADSRGSSVVAVEDEPSDGTGSRGPTGASSEPNGSSGPSGAIPMKEQSNEPDDSRGSSVVPLDGEPNESNESSGPSGVLPPREESIEPADSRGSSVVPLEDDPPSEVSGALPPKDESAKSESSEEADVSRGSSVVVAEDEEISSGPSGALPSKEEPAKWTEGDDMRASDGVTTSTGSSSSSSPPELAFLLFHFGGDGFNREPTKDEVEELICITNNYLQEKVEGFAIDEITDETTPIQFFATDINWKYSAENQFHPVVVTFSADVTYANSLGQRLDQGLVFDAIMSRVSTEEDIVDYIKNHVWNVSWSSIFSGVTQVDYKVLKGQSAAKEASSAGSRLAEASCPENKLPTVSPLISLYGAGAMGTVDPEDVEGLVYFRLDYTGQTQLEEGPDVEDVESLLCATNHFIAQQVSDATQDSSIVSTSSNIGWVTSSSAAENSTSAQANITIHFTVETSYGADGALVPVDTVTSALQGKDEDLVDFMLSEGVENYMDNLMINPLMELAMSMTLQALPPGTPVQRGVLDALADCAGSASAASANSDDTNKGSSLNLQGIPTDNEDGNNEPMDLTGSADLPSSPSVLSEDLPTMTINVSFVVSNLEGITDPTKIADKGLSSSWPLLVENVVADLEAKPTSLRKRGRRALLEQGIAQMEYKENSAFIFRVTDVPCLPYSAPDLKCHEVKAQYELAVNPSTDDSVDDEWIKTATEDPEAKRHFEVGTYKAIYDGTYFSILKSNMPDSPLFIGFLPVQDDNDGPNIWKVLFILAFITLAIFCCCVVAYFFFVKKNENNGDDDSKRDELKNSDNFQTMEVHNSSNTDIMLATEDDFSEYNSEEDGSSFADIDLEAASLQDDESEKLCLDLVPFADMNRKPAASLLCDNSESQCRELVPFAPAESLAYGAEMQRLEEMEQQGLDLDLKRARAA